MNKDIEYMLKVYHDYGHLKRSDAIETLQSYLSSLGETYTFQGLSGMVSRGYNLPEGKQALYEKSLQEPLLDSVDKAKVRTIIEAHKAYFEEKKRRLKKDKEVAYVLYMSDTHKPHTYTPFIKLIAKVIGRFQPVFVSTLSDGFDFTKQSNFKNRLEKRVDILEDDISQLLRTNLHELNLLRSYHSGFLPLAILGNHDLWYSLSSDYSMLTFTQELASQDVIFTDIPDKENYIEIIPSLWWSHGVGYSSRNDYFARKNYEQFKTETGITHDASLILGHLHRSSITPVYTEKVIINGWLGGEKAHYKRLKSAWDHTITISLVDFANNKHHTQKIDLIKTGTGATCIVNGEKFTC